jgi:hypothetical protein
MFENCFHFFRTASRVLFVASFLKHKLQILTGENFILNDQNGANPTSAVRFLLNDRTAALFGGLLGLLARTASRAVSMIILRKIELSIRENAANNSKVSRVLAKQSRGDSRRGFLVSNHSQR